MYLYYIAIDQTQYGSDPVTLTVYNPVKDKSIQYPIAIDGRVE